jgi:hypothetical protein
VLVSCFGPCNGCIVGGMEGFLDDEILTVRCVLVPKRSRGDFLDFRKQGVHWCISNGP